MRDGIERDLEVPTGATEPFLTLSNASRHETYYVRPEEITAVYAGTPTRVYLKNGNQLSVDQTALTIINQCPQLKPRR